MIPYIRRKKILETLHSKEIVYLDEIAEIVNVSQATIRRDLKLLEEENQVEILQGGAAKIKINRAEKSSVEKMTINEEEKEIVGDYASTLVSDGQFIFIGPGTTENWMISGLKGKDVTVVTNGVFHIQKCVENDIRTKLLGGDIKNDLSITIGYEAIKQVEKMNFDKCFIGASGFTLDRGASTSQSSVAEINRTVIEHSKEVYLIVDSTKLGKDSKYKFADITDLTKIITTGDIPEEYKEIEKIYIIDVNELD
ncbi:DeoR/GlpR family DNA-binding transcription regulator [Mycoplasmatota bacterium WC44]